MNTETSDFSQQLDVIIYLLQQTLDTQKGITEWVPLDDCKHFLGYGATQMSSLIKKESLVVSQIGRRKFISRKSLLGLLQRNIL